MKVILVDDEPPGRLALRQQLAGLPDAEIVAECADGASAIEAIVKHAPDILFLDIQLGAVSGLRELEGLVNAVDKPNEPAASKVTASPPPIRS